MRTSHRKTWLLWGMLLLFLYGSLEGIAWVGLQIMAKVHHLAYEPMNVLSGEHRRILARFLEGDTPYLTYSPDLGWTIKPKGQTDLYQTNSQGIRGSHDYQQTPPAGVLRIAAFGDSFTHASDVRDEETWQAYLRQQHPQLEVLNFGVPGYGTDQAYLRYLQEGRRYQPQIVLIGFMAENIFRHVNIFRPFYGRNTEIPLSKPRFLVKNGSLEFLPNPLHDVSQYRELLAHPEPILAEMGAYDYYYQRAYKKGAFDVLPSVRFIKIIRQQFSEPQDILVQGYYNEDSEAFRVTVGILDEFYRAVQEDGAVPIMLVFQERHELSRYWREGTRRYQPLLSHFEEQGYAYIDLIEAFDAFKARERFLLNKDSMIRLRDAEVPEDLVSELKELKHQEFSDEETFSSTAKALIGEESLAAYREQIVSSARIDETASLVPAHYSPLANELAAQYILKYLQKHELLHEATVIHNLGK